MLLETLLSGFIIAISKHVEIDSKALTMPYKLGVIFIPLLYAGGILDYFL
jgi:hypothetical protein